MCRYLISGLLLLSYIAVSISRPLTRKDKNYLLAKMTDWDDAPEAEKILNGTVTVNFNGTKKYKFVYTTANGSACIAKLRIKENGNGRYDWECLMKKRREPETEEEDDSESYDFATRQLHPDDDNFMKGTGTIEPIVGNRNKSGGKAPNKGKKGAKGGKAPNKKAKPGVKLRHGNKDKKGANKKAKNGNKVKKEFKG
uniref:Voltage-dependent N-type calcium channel subunit alpha-1B n=1 Tax=Lygus hesperus TaxID=30085 RepID=A0A0A9XDB3_LYGHE